MKKIIEKWNSWLDDLAKDRIALKNKESINYLINEFKEGEIFIGETGAQLKEKVRILKNEVYNLSYHHKDRQLENFKGLILNFKNYLDGRFISEPDSIPFKTNNELWNDFLKKFENSKSIFNENYIEDHYACSLEDLMVLDKK